jgi:hypothetical protein
MRTEDDLRAAFVTLERHAPAAVRVMPPDQRRPLVRRRRIASMMATGVTATAAATAAIIMIVGAGPTVRAGSPVAHESVPASLRKAILTAFDSTRGDILQIRSSVSNGAAPRLTGEQWYQPWLIQPGQQVHLRTLTQSQNGKLWRDIREVYTMPSHGYPVQAMTTQVNYANQNWWTGSQGSVTLIPGYLASVRDDMANGRYLVAGHTKTNGQQAIELRYTRELGRTHRKITTLLWVNEETYLPVQQETIMPSAQVFDTYQFLPATPGNLSLLQVSVPSGFHRIPAP